MSITEAFYGVGRPSRARKIIFHVIYLTFALALYGYWEDFIPTHGWNSYGSIIAATLSVVATALFIWAYSTGRAQFKSGISRFGKVFAYSLLPIIVFGFVWFAVVHGVAAGLTFAIGEASTAKVMTWKEAHHSRRSCDYRLYAKELEAAFPKYICLSEKEYTSLPQRTEVTLFGLRSSLGFKIKSWGNESAK